MKSKGKNKNVTGGKSINNVTFEQLVKESVSGNPKPKDKKKKAKG
jgi:hypothetical protein